MTSGSADVFDRLSVNLAPDVADALRHWCAVHDLSITEGVRRAIAIWNFLEAERAAGNQFGVIEGDRIRDVVLT